jgi:hypothetical protein
MSDFEAQLERMLEKEKIARVNNEHFTSVTILKEIVHHLSYSLDHPLLQ